MALIRDNLLVNGIRTTDQKVWLPKRELEQDIMMDVIGAESYVWYVWEYVFPYIS